MTYVMRPIGGLGTAGCTRQCLDGNCWDVCEPTAPPAPQTGGDARTVCVNLMNAWIGQNPQYKDCLSRAAREDIVATCMKWRDGRITLDAAKTEQDKIVRASCTPAFKSQCEKAYDAWAAANPTQAQCVTSKGRNDLIALCVEGKHDNWSQATAAKKWNAAITALCAAVPQPAPVPPAPVVTTPPAQPPPAPPPVPTTPEPTPQPVPAPVVYGPEGGGLDPNAMPQEESSGLRKWGPVVGVLLLVGAGLYVARKRK